MTKMEEPTKTLLLTTLVTRIEHSIECVCVCVFGQ